MLLKEKNNNASNNRRFHVNEMLRTTLRYAAARILGFFYNRVDKAMSQYFYIVILISYF